MSPTVQLIKETSTSKDRLRVNHLSQVFSDKNHRRSLSRPSDNGDGAKKVKRSPLSKNLEQVMTGGASVLVALE